MIALYSTRIYILLFLCRDSFGRPFSGFIECKYTNIFQGSNSVTNIKIFLTFIYAVVKFKPAYEKHSIIECSKGDQLPNPQVNIEYKHLFPIFISL